MDLRFLAPLCAGETSTDEERVVEIHEYRKWVRLQWTCRNGNGGTVREGQGEESPG
jgi:acyl dehydratase